MKKMEKQMMKRSLGTLAAIVACCCVSLPLSAQERSDTIPDRAFTAAEGAALESRVSKWEKVMQYLPRVSGYVQLRYQYGDDISSFDVARVRLNLVGDIGRHVDYKIQLELASPKLIDGYLRFKFCPAFNVQVGQFLVPFSLEGPMGPLALETIANAPVVSDICGSTPDTRDVGISFYGGFAKRKGYNVIDYAVGVFNGEGKNKADVNKSKDIIGRLNINPLRPLTLSGSFSWGERSETYIENMRAAAGGQWNGDKLLLRSEYLWHRQKSAGVAEKRQGCYALAGWHINSKVMPLLRYDYYDNALGGGALRQSDYLVGVDYYPIKHLRLQANYTFTHYDVTGTPNKNLFAIMVSGIF